jgi:hypothetical protein
MKLAVGLAAASILGVSAAAQAVTVATLTYGDLSGNYTGNAMGGTFNAHAVNLPNLRSTGDVARLVNPIGTADFQAGFIGLGTSADFVLNMTLGAISGGMRSGVGSFTSTDADGDTVTGNLNGMWQVAGAFLSFSGTLDNVIFTDVGVQDGMYNGTTAGTNFILAGLIGQVFNGAIVQLTTNPSGGFFLSDFSDSATGLNAQVLTVPLPPAAWAGMATLAGVVAVRRLRRR